ncbi:four helix bundle protein [candidate division KSB1 bacterium]|nr:four helix bundle protein [candidate division KSB1 bacterium]
MVFAKVESYRDLIVWQKSHEFAIELFKTKFAKKASEPLAAKIRERAAVVAQTIAIGFKRRGKKDKLYRYRGALAAIQELEYLLLLANDLGLLKNFAKLAEERESIERMIKGLIHSNSPAPERK